MADDPAGARPPGLRRHLDRGPLTLSVMPTFTCPAACQDCGTFSSPQERTRLEADHITAAIDEAGELGFANVVFTGGEATLRWRDLLHGIRHATGLGLPTRLVTNAHWARTPDAAREKLALLIDAGLSEINYSTGDEHVRFVPIDRVANAVVAACERSYPVHVMVELKSDNGVTRESLLEHPLVAALPPEQLRHLSVQFSPWMPMTHEAVHAYPEGAAVDRRTIGKRPGCPSVLQTYTVQADGRIGACCGLGMRTIPELNVGRVGQPGVLARAVTEAEEDLLKLWIRYEGPERIVAWAAGHDPRIVWEGRYAHHCQFCHHLYHDPLVRQVILDHWEEVVAEVLRSAWLDDVHVPRTVADALNTASAPAS